MQEFVRLPSVLRHGASPEGADRGTVPRKPWYLLLGGAIGAFKVLSMGPKRLVLTLAIGYVYCCHLLVQLRIAKVNPFPPIDETSTSTSVFSRAYGAAGL